MIKYRVGLNGDPESNALARSIEDNLKDGKRVKVKNLSGFVNMVAWPIHNGEVDRSGYSILMMDQGNFFTVLCCVLGSHILNDGYFDFGWGGIEVTDE